MYNVAHQVQAQEEYEPEIAIADIRLTYEFLLSNGNFDEDKKVIENHFNTLIPKITARLTNELGSQFSIGNIEYSEGSIKINAQILAALLFITPIIQGHIAAQPSTINTVKSKQKYKRVCKSLKGITSSAIKNYDNSSIIENKGYTITPKPLDTLCEEWANIREN